MSNFKQLKSIIQKYKKEGITYLEAIDLVGKLRHSDRSSLSTAEAHELDYLYWAISRATQAMTLTDRDSLSGKQLALIQQASNSLIHADDILNSAKLIEKLFEKKPKQELKFIQNSDSSFCGFAFISRTNSALTIDCFYDHDVSQSPIEIHLPGLLPFIKLNSNQHYDETIVVGGTAHNDTYIAYEQLNLNGDVIQTKKNAFVIKTPQPGKADKTDHHYYLKLQLPEFGVRILKGNMLVNATKTSHYDGNLPFDSSTTQSSSYCQIQTTVTNLAID